MQMSSPRPDRRSRRVVAWAITGLTAALLPVGLATSTGAQAAEPCLSETYYYSAGDILKMAPMGCDDITPPETVISAVTPKLNGAGYINKKSVVFTFAGHYTDGDSGPLSYECQFFNTVATPTTWESCTSPKAYANLEDTTSVAYTFRVRATDANDAAINACDSEANPLDPTCLGEEVIQDVDDTPAATQVKIDTVAPNTFLSRLPVDDFTPDSPVVLTKRPTVVVNSNESAYFACTVNGKSLRPCNEGLVNLTKLKSGYNTFLARAIDRGGNLDPTPVSTRFFVPKNIKKNKGSKWRKVRSPGLFGNDYLTTNKMNQELVIKGVRNAREVRLIAPTGPRFGKIEVKVGESQWYTVDLFSKRASRMTQLLVRDQYSTPQQGKIRIRVKKLTRKRSSVRIDAIVVRGR